MHSPFFLLLRAGLALALLAATGRADAHASGLSQSEFQLDSAGHVDARLTFAHADATALARGETAPDLRDAMLHGVEVLADGDACAPSYLGEGAVGGDGVDVRAAFDCPHRPRTLVVSLPLLDELPPSHVHLARLSSNDHLSETPLRSGSSRATLVLSPPPASSWATATAVSLVACVLALGAFLWSRRTTRA